VPYQQSEIALEGRTAFGKARTGVHSSVAGLLMALTMRPSPSSDRRMYAPSSAIGCLFGLQREHFFGCQVKQTENHVGCPITLREAVHVTGARRAIAGIGHFLHAGPAPGVYAGFLQLSLESSTDRVLSGPKSVLPRWSPKLCLGR
jgi:hypothetical protein